MAMMKRETTTLSELRRNMIAGLAMVAVILLGTAVVMWLT